MRRSLLVGRIVHCLWLVLIASCHGGEPHGLGSPCSASSACRDGFVCAAGSCQSAATPDGGPAEVPDAPVAPGPDADADGETAPGDADAAMPDADADVAPFDADATMPDADVPPEAPDGAPEARDGGGDADGQPDTGGAEVSGRRCDLSQPFTTITPVMGLGSIAGSSDSGPHLSDDELTIYFGSARSGQTHLYSARRQDPAGAFSGVALMDGLNGIYLDDMPSLTENELTITWETTRTMDYRVMISTRSSPTGAWTLPHFIDNVSTPAMIGSQEGGPALLPHGEALYFHKTLGQDLDIYRAPKVGDGFGTPERLSTIATGHDELRATVSDDDSALYFASARPDGSKGSWDIWLSVRDAPGADFGRPSNVAELNTAGQEDPGWLSPDRCRLYFVRDDFVVGGRIFVASRTPAPMGDGGN